MLKINGQECTVTSTSLKFGVYKTIDDDFKEVYKKDSYPLFILVKFETDKTPGYFELDLENFKEKDFQKLANFRYEDIVSMVENTKFSIFELSINDKFTDSLDVETKAIVEFGDVNGSFVKTTIEITSQDFKVNYDGELEIKYVKDDKNEKRNKS